MSNGLELLLRKTGRVLADHQVARIFKVPEELTGTPCDFFGYTKIGRAILIEAKQVRRTSLPIGNKPGLTPFQWNALCEAHRADCIALICWAQGNMCATIGMDVAIELTQDRVSIPWKKISRRFIHPMEGSHAPLRVLEPWIHVPA